MDLRSTNLAKLDRRRFDVLVVGGGINGAVAAAALSARGARVALIDKGDFAGFTSQSSSNLAWGGIKYLETYEFGLVRKLCLSRNALLRAFPSSVKEIRFYAHLEQGFRKPTLLIWLGAWLYWLFGNFFTKPPRLLRKQTIAEEEPRIDLSNSAGGIEYSDAYLHDNDSRFVFGFVRRALDHGCIAANYVEATGVAWQGDHWQVEARDVAGDGAPFEITADVLINACGPFADQFNDLAGTETAHHHVFSKGIHLVVERITPHDRVLAFFADDGRLFFAIPMGRRTVIGTTDTRMPSPHSAVTDEDRAFVLDNINKRIKFDTPLTTDDIIAERCGVRPLVVEGSGAGSETEAWMKLSRKHAVDVDASRRQITIFGGKLTDCINVGDEITDIVADELGLALPHRAHIWYGEPPAEVRADFMHQAKLMGLDELTAPYASEPLSARLWRRYGRAAFDILEEIRRDPSMGQVLIETSEYLRAELHYTAEREMVVTLEDFLRRRSKIAMVVHRRRLTHSKGLTEASRIFFGDHAEGQWRRYFSEVDETTLWDDTP